MTPGVAADIISTLWQAPAEAGMQTQREAGRPVIWYRLAVPGGAVFGGLIVPREQEPWTARATLTLTQARARIDQQVRARCSGPDAAAALLAVRREILVRTRWLQYASGQAVDWLETCEGTMIREVG